MEKTRQQMLFDNQALDCEFGFTFNQHGYDPGEQPYAGNHLFKKHYYGSIGKIDNDEEEYCAIVLDGMNASAPLGAQHAAQIEFFFTAFIAKNTPFIPILSPNW